MIIASNFQAVAQQPAPATIPKEQELGIASYKKGDTKEAIKHLEAAVKKNGADTEAWYYLGLARLQNNDFKNARKALEKAVKLSPQMSKVHSALSYALLLSGKDKDAEQEAGQAIGLNQQDDAAHYVMGAVRLRQHRNSEAELEAETALKLNPGMALAYLLKSQALVGLYSDRTVGFPRPPVPYRIAMPVRAPRPVPEEELAERRKRSRQNLQFLSDAASALETYLSLNAANSETELWRTQLATLKMYAGGNDSDGERAFTGSEVTTKARILSKPEPMYSEAARRAELSGTVILSAILTADGRVDHILVLRALPLGLTQQSINVARKIKFIPATIDGKNVSMVVHLEYNFLIF